MFQIEFRDLVITDDDGNAYELENITVLDVEGKEHEIPNSKILLQGFLKMHFLSEIKRAENTSELDNIHMKYDNLS